MGGPGSQRVRQTPAVDRRQNRLSNAGSYQKLHSKGDVGEGKGEVGRAVAADVLDLQCLPCGELSKPDPAMAQGVPTSAASTPSDAKPSSGRLQRRATVPAAAIPCAAGLRSRAAWKKALAAAQTARVVVDGEGHEGPDVTPRPKGSSERQESAQKAAYPFTRRDSQRDSGSTATMVAEPTRRADEPPTSTQLAKASNADQEAWIAEELQMLQKKQEQQERKLTEVLGKSQQLSKSAFKAKEASKQSAAEPSGPGPEVGVSQHRDPKIDPK